MKKLDLIYKLYAQGTIDKNRFDELQKNFYQNDLKTIFYLGLTLGITLLITGIIFFIAANWSVIPPMLKLFGIEFLLIFFIALAYYFRDHDRLFHLFVMSSAILVGVSLAVFGQVFQTGADAYTLFATWTLLITFWAWMIRLPYLFMLWQVLLYLTVSLFYEQYIRPFDIMERADFRLIYIVAIHLLLLLSFYKNHTVLFSHRPNKILLLSATLIVTLIPAIEAIFSHRDYNIFIIILIVQSALLGAYFHTKKDLLQISLVLLNTLIFLEFVLAKNLLRLSSTETLLGFGIVTIAVTLGFGKMIKLLHRHYHKEDVA